jgi:hypothetical protein
MPVVTPDYSEAFQPLAPGEYAARICGYDLKSSKNSGARYVNWGLEVTEGDREGAKIGYNTMIEGKGAGILQGFLKAIDPSYDGGPFDPQSYVGSRLVMTVVEEEYNGKINPKVKSVRPFAGTEEDTPF